MTQRPDSVSDLDLMAYADGLLDAYPQRKRAIEAYLVGAPEAAAYVARISRQNEALRASCNALLSDAADRVPSAAHLAAGNGAPRNARRYGSLAAMLLAAVGLGWFLGESSNAPSPVSEAFLGEVADLDARTSEDAFPPAMPLQAAVDRPEASATMGAYQETSAIQLVAPDLSDLGFQYEGMRLVHSGTNDLVQLSYRVVGTSDQTMRLYIGPAALPATKERASIESRDRTLHYWRSGPFSVVTTFSGETPLSNRLLDRLAEEQPLLQIAPQPRGIQVPQPALNVQSRPGADPPAARLKQPLSGTATSADAASFN
ncbi:anti-sigma factor [Amorphus sp. 3PC139-8]|uniref:anti-sigma factor family protein n=1 Tax=Amorphus sp. 3PC139-8 TaxID=2735676 RepID=UPI00345CE193